ncbi:unnamed protein product [Chondrus crispus]|uniref:Integrase catalytic domain-containing protein n=1 Tax=Chondrus crispus TaxID=2769 RepID=R7QU26_CHOCR|nr:unnamed protein product [Chondrus crispus]CDF41213.1 unnamed protein product [Chondrus crispus]|eukprot:XP_005711507.1 unnamed protein product [Chondrus crispus]
MCIDYRALNKQTIKNQVPLPRIDEVWDQVGGSKCFSTIDLRSGYHQIRLRDADIQRTAFRTRYEDHLNHLRTILQILKEHQLYGKLSKCKFLSHNLEYLGHIISENGIQVNPKKIEAVQTCEAPLNVKQIQSILGICNYYPRFVKDFATIATPLSNLTRKGTPFQWGPSQKGAFEELKSKLIEPPVLRYADPSLPYEVASGASQTGVGAVLTQTDETGCRPVAYASRKLNIAEQGYSTHERELLAIAYSLQTWRPYLHGSKFKILIDHHPLKYLDSQRTLPRKQARWDEFMQEFDYHIDYIKGKHNTVAEALSRQYQELHQKSASVVKQLISLISPWLKSVFPKTLPFTTDYFILCARGSPFSLSIFLYFPILVSLNLELVPPCRIAIRNVDENILKSLEREYRKDPDFHNAFENPTAPFSKNKNRLYFENRLCIPKGKMREIVLHDIHESLFGAHRGFKKTLQYVRRHFYWPSMNKELHEYIKTCPKTNTNKTAILVVVDKLSKHTHFIPIESNHTAKDTAEVFYNEIYKHHGLPRKIISDRDTRFTSTLWKEFMKVLRVKLNLSTAFHPQTDGQSERAFRTLREMLRCFVSYTQRHWSKHLPGLEFAYNNHISDTTKQTPFFLEYGQHPLSVSDVLHSDGSETLTVTTQRFLENIRRANELAKLSITASNERNAEQVNKHRGYHSFLLGDQVMLSTKNLPLKTGRSKTSSPKYIGPFKVIDILAPGNAYKLKLPQKYQNLHPTFHISLLKPYYENQNRRTIGRESTFQTGDNTPTTIDIISHRSTQDSIEFLVSEKSGNILQDKLIDEQDLPSHKPSTQRYFDSITYYPPPSLFEDELLS